MLTFGSLFAGIGGLDLGLERAGLTCKWQVEINAFARRVLAKHWPDVRRHDDVRSFPPDGDWRVDLICGGFPCQDISDAGKRAGIEGYRSGLWSEFARIVGVLRPRYVLVENVSSLVRRGLDRVLADLASLGFDAEWQPLPAAAFGAPHIRERLFVLAYANGLDVDPGPELARRQAWSEPRQCGSTSMADALQPGLSLPQQEIFLGPAKGVEGRAVAQSTGWAPEPALDRVAHGVPSRVDRLKALGNAVVPQVAEFIGRLIVEADRNG